MAAELKWTISGRRKGSDGREVFLPTQEFATKREAVTAMEAQRKLKTQIDRFDREYRFTVRD